MSFILGFSLSKLLKYAAILIISMLLLSAGITGSVLVTRSRSQSNTLAIESDVVECAKPSLLYRYSTIVVTETPSDTRNDNPKGLTMDLFSLKKSDIIYHSNMDTHKNYELILPTSGLSRFIMPYNYYNRPWYLWSGSTIKITFKVVYKEKPSKAVLYLFKGETKINSFFSEKSEIPAYEEHTDMLSTDGNNSVFWQVQDNDYYYIAVYTFGTKDTIFQSNITFNFTYIDVEDYPWLKDTSERATGINQPLTLHHSISSPNNNRTLCYMHPIPSSSLESPSIHLNTVYFTDTTLEVLLIAIPFGLLTFYIITLLGCSLFYNKPVICHHQSRKAGYMIIN